MTYEDTLGWMFGLERFGIKLGLDNITEFLSRIGNPHRDFKSVHVTGTNGKGSVCAFTAEILRRHGLRTGLYISPHLVDFRERISVDNRLVPERDVVQLAEELKEEMDSMAAESPEKQLTFFEFTTGLAFKYFSQRKVDIVVAEVGMGGRMDATNVLLPEATAITRIGLEHTSYLGGTLAEIAREKAGIIKQGVGLVACERDPEVLSIISSVCGKKGVRFRHIGRDFDVSHVRQSLRGTKFDYSDARSFRDLRTRLIGKYQAENAAVAVALTEVLSERGIHIADEAIRRSIQATKWPGRLEVVSRDPLLIFDGSHNPDGVSMTVGILQELGLRPMTFVLGCMRDKDARGIVRALAPNATKIVSTHVNNRRALDAALLGEIVREAYNGDQQVVVPAGDAIGQALSNPRGKGVCIIGSLYLVGEAIQWWNEKGQQRWARRAHKI